MNYEELRFLNAGKCADRIVQGYLDKGITLLSKINPKTDEEIEDYNQVVLFAATDLVHYEITNLKTYFKVKQDGKIYKILDGKIVWHDDWEVKEITEDFLQDDKLNN